MPVFSYRANKKKRKAAKLEAQAVQISNKQAKRQFLQEFRTAQASAMASNIASLAGGYESSRGAGTQSSLVTQRDLAVKEFDEQVRLGAAASAKRISAAKYDFYGQVAQMAFNFAMSPTGQNIFTKKTPPPKSPGGGNKYPGAS